MHTRRLATFLLGIWMGCSLLMDFIQIQNLRLPAAIIAAPSEQASGLLQKLAPALSVENARLLLRYEAVELSRRYSFVWEQVQMGLALLLGLCLFLGTQRRILPLVLCGLLLLLLMFQHLGVTPELVYRGREADFPPGSTTFGTQARVWALDQIYAWLEATKLLLAAVLASYLFVFRTGRQIRKHAQPPLVRATDF